MFSEIPACYIETLQFCTWHGKQNFTYSFSVFYSFSGNKHYCQCFLFLFVSLSLSLWAPGPGFLYPWVWVIRASPVYRLGAKAAEGQRFGQGILYLHACLITVLLSVFPHVALLRFYEQLPEVKKKREEEKRKSEYTSNRLRAQHYKMVSYVRTVRGGGGQAISRESELAWLTLEKQGLTAERRLGATLHVSATTPAAHRRLCPHS